MQSQARQRFSRVARGSDGTFSSVRASQMSSMQTRTLWASQRASNPSFQPTPKLAHALSGDHPRPLRMLFFGKPGSGKGTLSAKIMKKYDVTQLSAGDLLRSHIAEGTEIGRAAEAIVASGGLIPDDVMTRIVTSKLDGIRSKNWILDGFPRTIPQGKLLDSHLRGSQTPLTLIINLEVPDSVILDRIGDRWLHLPSGRVYNAKYNPPKVSGRDDVTGETLIQRPDDNPDIFARRLRAFYEATAPLLTYYASINAKVITLQGNTSDEIWPHLDGILSSDFRLPAKTPRGPTEKVTVGAMHEGVIHVIDQDPERLVRGSAKL